MTGTKVNAQSLQKEKFSIQVQKSVSGQIQQLHVLYHMY